MLNDKFIFVFWCNLAGRHGKGSAKFARQHLGAKYGVGEGRTGQCYALPTKNHQIKTRDLGEIEKSVEVFIAYAKTSEEETFLVTPIGCGLAGYEQRQIRAIFMRQEIPDNVVFSKEWFQKYKETETYK